MVYLDEFLNDSPRLTYNALANRIKRTAWLNDELADYFRERVAIEEAHIKQLQRLHRKTFVSDRSVLGELEPVWAALLEETYTTIQHHAQLAQLITEKVERPLRNRIHQDEEWAVLQRSEPKLLAAVRTFNEKDHKIAKLKKSIEVRKSSRKAQTASQKLNDTAMSFESSKQRWKAQIPPFLEQYEKVDRESFGFIKQCVHTFEELHIAHHRQAIQRAEHVQTVAQAADVEAEVQQVCRNKKMLATSWAPPRNTPHRENGLLAMARRSSLKGRSEVAAPLQAPPLHTLPDPLTLQRTASSPNYSSHSSPITATREQLASPHPPLPTMMLTQSQPSTTASALPTKVVSPTPIVATAVAESKPVSLVTSPTALRPQSPVDSAHNDRHLIQSNGYGHGRGDGSDDGKGSEDNNVRSPPPRPPPLIEDRGNFYSDDDCSDGDDGAAGSVPKVKFSINASSIKESDEQAAKVFSQVTGSLRIKPSVRRRGRREVGRPTLTNPPNPVVAATITPAVTNHSMASTIDTPSETATSTTPSIENSPALSIRAQTLPVTSHSFPMASSPTLSTSPPWSSSSVMNFALGSTRSIGSSAVTESSLPTLAHTSHSNGGTGLQFASTFSASNPSSTAFALPPYAQLLTHEQLHARCSSEGVDKLIVTGEVRLKLQSVSAADVQALRIRVDAITPDQAIDKLVINSKYMQRYQAPSSDQSPISSENGEYQLLPISAVQMHASTLPLFKYYYTIPEHKKHIYLPLNLGAVWKCQHRQISLLVTCAPNRKSVFALSAGPGGGGDLTTDTADTPPLSPHLDDVTITVPIKGHGCQVVSKPNGQWHVQAQQLIWPLGTVTLEPPASGDSEDDSSREPSPTKLLMRAHTEREARAAPLEVRFSFSNVMVAPLRTTLDVAADTPTGATITTNQLLPPIVRVTAGKYLVMPTLKGAGGMLSNKASFSSLSLSLPFNTSTYSLASPSGSGTNLSVPGSPGLLPSSPVPPLTPRFTNPFISAGEVTGAATATGMAVADTTSPPTPAKPLHQQLPSEPQPQTQPTSVLDSSLLFSPPSEDGDDINAIKP
ncbi:Suppressor of Profilin deletion [Dimargaris verticillata]|uniref:Suppressor of Profilin deletion n=1 Tax=Dimargaris verticillata TaxID=2761393 RepID=A0A9W8BAT2_9FUNG|nr:Suppressor of Profilin deletion [Dimargaris verticillata]